MYLLKKNTFDLIKIKFNLLLILSILFFSTNIYAEEKFVGFIESLDGKAFKNDNGKKIKLNVFDQIFVGSEIVIESNSNATISFLDNSILTLSSDSTFVVKNFDNLSQNPEFRRFPFHVEQKEHLGRVHLEFPMKYPKYENADPKIPCLVFQNYSL